MAAAGAALVEVTLPGEPIMQRRQEELRDVVLELYLAAVELLGLQV
jgi:hypothetical protein